MGKKSILTKEQKIILDEVAKDPYLSSEFYFTGGTALSEIYLKHRQSEDLDFFTEKPLDIDKVRSILTRLSSQYSFTFTSRYSDPVDVHNLTFSTGVELKVDFAQYPYKQVKEGIFYNDSLQVDSKFDIGTNKLATITMRTTVKDAVDLYFLLQEFSFWDLREGVLKKFHMKIEPVLIAGDFFLIQDFTYLPNMYKPLSLEELKVFYRDLSEKLAGTSIE